MFVNIKPRNNASVTRAFRTTAIDHGVTTIVQFRTGILSKTLSSMMKEQIVDLSS
jgi:hypothetical protein